jgi:hypothetical protein
VDPLANLPLEPFTRRVHDMISQRRRAAQCDIIPCKMPAAGTHVPESKIRCPRCGDDGRTTETACNRHIHPALQFIKRHCNVSRWHRHAYCHRCKREFVTFRRV